MINISKLTTRIANSFGALGYIFVIFQWMFSIMIYFQFIKLLLPSNDTPRYIENSTVATNSEPSLLMIIFIAFVVVFAVILTIYYFVKLPSMLARTGKKAVNKTAKSAVPFVLKIQHKKDTKKNRMQLTPKLIVILKLVIITLPMIFIFISQFYAIDILAYDMRVSVGLWLLDFSLAMFFLQYVFARLFSVKINDIY